MQTFLRGRRVGYWLSEKKMKKLNFQAFADLCRKRGIDVVKLDLSQPLEEQGQLDVIIHKLTDLILEADQNDSQAMLLVQRVQDYIDAHPETIILDPLPAIRTLLDRCKSYQLIHRLESCMKDERICSPPFMVLNADCSPDVLEQIRRQGLTFPFICKTRVAHGTNSHEMAIIFSEEDLQDIRPPCVIQSFINHNAVLYKVFVVGDSYTVVERPSLKNFPSGPADRKAIFFNSHNVSKPESSSHLTTRENVEGVSQPPNDDVIRKLSRSLRQALGVSLFGIDVIINNQTGQHAVIDINAFPGYEGVPQFFSDLLSHITAVLQTHSAELGGEQPKGLPLSSAPGAGPWIVDVPQNKSKTVKGAKQDWGEDTTSCAMSDPLYFPETSTLVPAGAPLSGAEESGGRAAKHYSTHPKLLHDCGRATTAEEKRSASLNEQEGGEFPLTRRDFPECQEMEFSPPGGRTSAGGTSED